MLARKASLVVAAIAAATITTTNNAVAATFQLDFTAEFGSYDPSSPYDSISGSFTWEAASLGAKIEKLMSVDLVIGNHAYTLAETATENQNINSQAIGGIINGGVHSLSNYSNDFVINWHRTRLNSPQLIYNIEESGFGWNTQDFSKFDIYEIAAVPLPAAIWLFSSCLGLISWRNIRRHMHS